MRERSSTADALSINNEELLSQLDAEERCHRQWLPDELGVGRSNIFKLENELNYIETHYAPCKDLAVLSRMDNQEPRMVVTLGLKGQSRFCGTHGDDLVFKEGYTAITTFNSSEGARQYQGNKAVTQLRFSMSKSWLEKQFGENRIAGLFNRNMVQMVSHQPISAPGIFAARQLLNCPVSQAARPLFRHGQAISLLASELSPLFSEPLHSTLRFNQRDKDIAHLARDILLKEFKNPPSVEDLARRAGTNQCKLKQLFHHFFNSTPYGLLLDVRMKKAYELLKITRCPVNIAAEQVGYQHASNFSTAFVKYFGFSPRQISKNN